MKTLENNEIFDYFTKSNDETYIEVTEKDFNWLVKSKFTIDEIVYQLGENFEIQLYSHQWRDGVLCNWSFSEFKNSSRNARWVG